MKDALFAYFRLLQRESRRAGKAFESEINDDADRITYRWRGHAKATGQLFFSPTCHRVFFLELLGERKDSLALFGRLAGTFRSLDPSGPDLWSVLGLSVRFPKQANLDSRSFHAGRTLLNFSARGFRAQASRWGFGSQLAERHGISHWAASAFGLPVADTSCDHDRLEWEGRGRLGWTTRLLVRLDRASNRIVAVRASYRTPEWRPTWDWLEP